MQYTIVDDYVETAPIYRCDGKAEQPIVRTCENHDLHMEQEPTWTESQQKQHAQSKAVPSSGSLGYNQNPWECDKHIWSVVRLRFGPVAELIEGYICFEGH